MHEDNQEVPFVLPVISRSQPVERDAHRRLIILALCKVILCVFSRMRLSDDLARVFKFPAGL